MYFIGRALPCLIFKVFFQPNLLAEKNHQPNFYNNSTITLGNEGTKFLALLSESEIKLDWLRRKRLIISMISLFFLIVSFGARAQRNALRPQLMIGDKIPNVELATILNYSDTSVNFSKLKGKALILDFWATYCSACLIEFPKMDSLQKIYSKSLQIFLVDQYVKDNKKILADFLIAERIRIKDFSLPLVQYSPSIREVFPPTSMPHYIWVGQDGRIKAITGPKEVNGENIRRLIAGLTLDLKTKLY